MNKIKHVFLLTLMSITLFACNKDGKESSKISPPKWIHGTWHAVKMGMDDYDESILGEYKIKFSKKNIEIRQNGIVVTHPNKVYKYKESKGKDLIFFSMFYDKKNSISRQIT